MVKFAVTQTHVLLFDSMVFNWKIWDPINAKLQP